MDKRLKYGKIMYIMIDNKNNNNVVASPSNKGQSENSLAVFYGIGAVVVILLIIFFSTRGTELVVKDESGNPLDIPTEDISAGSVNNVVKKVPSISYADALVKYKDARIQIDALCQAFPNNVTYKNGTSIMIDNRSAINHTLKIGSTYTVDAYKFKIIKLTSNNLPETLLVDCDQYQNVATILVQK